MTLKSKSSALESAAVLTESQTEQLKKYIVKNIPAAGGIARDLEITGQMTL